MGGLRTGSYTAQYLRNCHWKTTIRLVRLATDLDLIKLLALFEVSDVSQFVRPIEEAKRVWRETMTSDNVFVFVAPLDEVIVATCTLITAPNLLRRGRSHEFLENVMTHPSYQGRGFGKAVVTEALNYAWELNCHHVLMQSGRADPKVYGFYEGLGFKPGLRTGHVALRPAE